MGNSSKNIKTTFREIFKENVLYILSLFFQVVVIISLMIYHIIVRIYWIVAIHTVLLISIIAFSIYLRDYKHTQKRKKLCRNKVINSNRGDRVFMFPKKGKHEEAVSVDEEVLKNNSANEMPVIVRPPLYEQTKRTLRRKQLVYFTIETDLVNFKWCSTCRNWRTPTTLHCARCNCCVHNFDHHCMWLNNCITKRIYGTFIIYVILVLLSSYFSVFSVIQLFFISKDVKKLHFGILLGVLSIFAIFGAIFTTILIGFHINLRIRRISTYEYIKIRYTPEITNNIQYFSEKRIRLS